MRTYTHMHTLTMTILLLFASFTVMGQQIAEKTLVKSFNLGEAQTVSLNVDAPVEVRETDNPLLRVQMKISIKDGSNALLKSLVRAGRYNLKHAINEEGTYELTAPALDMPVKIGGKPLADQVSFVIIKPRKVAFSAPALEQEKEAAQTASSL
ncbi:MAG: hypothetical protein GVY26_19315 [Bacteroidetes bacterium]|nr:hypothetical protein [Bacteroidota bacterium]